MNAEDKMRRLLEGARGHDNGGDLGWDGFAARAHRALAVRRTLIGAGIAVVVFAAVAVAAALRPSGLQEPSFGPGQPPGESVTAPDTSPTPSPYEGHIPMTTIEVWWTKGETIYPDVWRVESTPSIGRFAMAVLTQGIGGIPQGSSAIPQGTELLDIHIEDGVASVDLSSEFESGGGSLSMQLRVAQVVYTLTQFDTVQGVRFRIDGRDVESIGGEGLVVDPPRTRKHYEDFVAPIIVDDPRPDERIPGTFTMTGTANVFEATVSYRVVDDQGKVLIEGFTTATCGTGCRGDFSEKIKTGIEQQTYVTLEVFESSAEDGRPLHMVRIPLTLMP